LENADTGTDYKTKVGRAGRNIQKTLQ